MMDSLWCMSTKKATLYLVWCACCQMWRWKCRSPMSLLPDTWNCRLRMYLECQEHFPRHQLQRKPLVSDPGMHHDTCIMHVPWCMSGSLTHSDRENVSGIPGACAAHNFTYLARGPCVICQMKENWARWMQVTMAVLHCSSAAEMSVKIQSDWKTRFSMSDFIFSSGSFYLYGLTLIPPWISNYINYKVWDE